jgi:hypothetical protein
MRIKKQKRKADGKRAEGKGDKGGRKVRDGGKKDLIKIKEEEQEKQEKYNE